MLELAGLVGLCAWRSLEYGGCVKGSSFWKGPWLFGGFGVSLVFSFSEDLDGCFLRLVEIVLASVEVSVNCALPQWITSLFGAAQVARVRLGEWCTVTWRINETKGHKSRETE